MFYDTVIQGAEILDRNDGKTYQVGIKDGRIAYIGQEPVQGSLVIDGRDHLLAPGLVNAHTHIAMTLFRSYADDMVLMDWLQDKIWPMENHLTGNDVYWGSLLGIAEMIRTGTTAFADMYFLMEATARAVASSGIRAALSRGLTGSSAADGKARLDENSALFDTWNGVENDRIHVMYGPHAPYTCAPEYICSIVKEAARKGAEIHMHLAETKGEVADCLKKYDKSPIALMEELGLFELGTLAAHCVHVDDKDMEILRKHHVRIASNPQSNLKLASGIAPIGQMLQKGIVLGLGTDGASSNNNLDMLEEVRLASMLSKVKEDNPRSVPAKTAIKCGTLEGAKAIGFDEVGAVTTGYKADLVLYDLKEPEWFPRNDRYSLLCNAASSHSVSHVFVDGKLLYENGEYLTLDYEKVCAEAQRCAERLSRA